MKRRHPRLYNLERHRHVPFSFNRNKIETTIVGDDLREPRQTVLVSTIERGESTKELVNGAGNLFQEQERISLQGHLDETK